MPKSPVEEVIFFNMIKIINNDSSDNIEIIDNNFVIFNEEYKNDSNDDYISYDRDSS